MFPQFVATQTEISPYGKKGNTFYQGIIRMVINIIQFASQVNITTYKDKNQHKKGLGIFPESFNRFKWDVEGAVPYEIFIRKIWLLFACYSLLGNNPIRKYCCLCRNI